MTPKENSELKAIAKHVATLNEELGNVKNDVSLIKRDICWIKRIGYFMAGIMTIGLGKILFI